MSLNAVILLIVSIILVIVSSWNLSIFKRLNKASVQYKSDDVFNEACHISKKYVKDGLLTSIVMLVVSILLLIGSSVNIYISF